MTINRYVCPICNHTFTKYDDYHESLGLVELHAYCNHCGYTEEMAYSPLIKGFTDQNIFQRIKHTIIRTFCYIRYYNKRNLIKTLWKTNKNMEVI